MIIIDSCIGVGLHLGRNIIQTKRSRSETFVNLYAIFCFRGNCLQTVSLTFTIPHIQTHTNAPHNDNNIRTSIRCCVGFDSAGNSLRVTTSAGYDNLDLHHHPFIRQVIIYIYPLLLLFQKYRNQSLNLRHDCALRKNSN